MQIIGTTQDGKTCVEINDKIFVLNDWDDANGYYANCYELVNGCEPSKEEYIISLAATIK